jgi:hypothetical protein
VDVPIDVTPIVIASACPSGGPAFRLGAALAAVDAAGLEADDAAPLVAGVDAAVPAGVPAALGEAAPLEQAAAARSTATPRISGGASVRRASVRRTIRGEIGSVISLLHVPAQADSSG